MNATEGASSTRPFFHHLINQPSLLDHDFAVIYNDYNYVSGEDMQEDRILSGNSA